MVLMWRFCAAIERKSRRRSIRAIGRPSSQSTRTAKSPLAFLAAPTMLRIEIFIAAAAFGYLSVAFGRALREHLGTFRNRKRQ